MFYKDEALLVPLEGNFIASLRAQYKDTYCIFSKALSKPDLQVPHTAASLPLDRILTPREGRAGWQGVCDVWSKSISPEALWLLELAVSMQHHGAVEMKLYQVLIKITSQNFCFFQSGAKMMFLLVTHTASDRYPLSKIQLYKTSPLLYLSIALCVLSNCEF